MITSGQNILTKTRAEEYEADVWGRFYIPPYFNKLGLTTATKSSYIVGARGSGKTMLLKYLDYNTAFSKKRQEIPSNEIAHIGIYWRADTQFCNSLNHRGISEHDWISTFESYFSLVIAIEVIRSLKAIANSAYDAFSNVDLNRLELNSIPDFHPEFPNTPGKLEAYLESKRRAFSTWSSHVTGVEKPILPPGKTFLDSLIADIRSFQGLEDAAFYIYVDEVENLVLYQRRVLNSFLKHSQKPLIVSFTSKELSDETATTGSESINATHDFRLLSLDELLSPEEKKVFFSEVFLANLDLAEDNSGSDLLKELRSLDLLESRMASERKDELFRRIRTRFPSKTHKEFALEALDTPRIYNILKELIERALKNHQTKITFDDFLKFKRCPEALLIIPALLNRAKNKPEDLIEKLTTYAKDTSGPFKNWVHNNLFGAILELYRPYKMSCPLYSGFDTFFTMSNNNLRHFLILSYKALEMADLADEDQNVVSVYIQARSAYESADQLIREIKTFGEQGERLRMFVLRLGSIFRTLQSTPSMSEPEQNQFTISSGKRALDADETNFLGEAKKYGIISEQLETKTKNIVGTDIVDYQLNPIYSPYFQISYRRKRKIDVSVEDFVVLALGSEDEYKKLSSKLFRDQGADLSQTELW